MLNSTYLPSETSPITIYLYHSSSLSTSGSSAFLVPFGCLCPSDSTQQFLDLPPGHLEQPKADTLYAGSLIPSMAPQSPAGTTSLINVALTLPWMSWFGLGELIFFLVGSLVLCFGFCRRWRWWQADVSAAAKRWLRVRDFSVSCALHKELGGSRASTAALNWAQGYSRPQNILLSTETGGADLCWGLVSSHWPVGSHLFVLSFIPPLFIPVVINSITHLFPLLAALTPACEAP